jgi:hypothetical protein
MLSGCGAFLVVVGGLVSGCTQGVAVPSATVGEAAVSTTAPLSAPSSVETGAPSTTTTTLSPGPVEIPGSALLWEPGVAHSTDRFFVPVTLTPDVPGWRSLGSGALAFTVSYVPEGENETRATVTFGAYRPEQSGAHLIDEIISIDGVVALTEPVHVEIGTHPAVVVDVEGAPDTDSRKFSLGHGPCTVPGGTALFWDEGAGYKLMAIPGERMTLGVPACFLSRIWVVDVDGAAIMVVAVVQETEDFTRLMPAVGRLLAGVQFGR